MHNHQVHPFHSVQIATFRFSDLVLNLSEDHITGREKMQFPESHCMDSSSSVTTFTPV